MKHPLFLSLILTLLLSACSPASATRQGRATPTTSPEAATADTLTRADSQGAVTVEITLLNLGQPAEQLEFAVSLNTHSVDLSMDLALLATLTTDTGITVQALRWDAPRGGHHVSGKLVFPSTHDGRPILDGATKLTLTLVNLDVPLRVFEWRLK